jgi:hypothetical protein
MGRVKRLEDKMMLNKPGVLIVQTEYGETTEQTKARVKKQYPDYEKLDLIFVMNFGNASIPDIDSQIEQEEKKIHELKRKTKEAVGTQKKTKAT